MTGGPRWSPWVMLGSCLVALLALLWLSFGGPRPIGLPMFLGALGVGWFAMEANRPTPSQLDGRLARTLATIAADPELADAPGVQQQAAVARELVAAAHAPAPTDVHRAMLAQASHELDLLDRMVADRQADTTRTLRSQVTADHAALRQQLTDARQAGIEPPEHVWQAALDAEDAERDGRWEDERAALDRVNDWRPAS